jgi:hypothetical protein
MAEQELSPKTATGTRILPAVQLIPGIKSGPNGTRIMSSTPSNGTGPYGTRIMQTISTADCTVYSNGFCVKASYKICPFSTPNLRLSCPECQKRPASSQE